MISRPSSKSAGLITIAVDAHPARVDREPSLFERTLADARQLPDDKALQVWAAEARVVLPLLDEGKRVLGIAEKPPRQTP